MQKLDMLGQTLFGGVGIEILGGPDRRSRVRRRSSPRRTPGSSSRWIRDTTPFTARRGTSARRSTTRRRRPCGARRRSSCTTPRLAADRLQARDAGGRERAARAIAWYVERRQLLPGPRAARERGGRRGVPAQRRRDLDRGRRARSSIRRSPSSAATLIVFYNKRNSGQSIWGIGGQRVSSTGAAPLGDARASSSSRTTRPSEEAPRAVPAPNGAMCFVEQGNFGTTLLGFRVDGNGDALWTPSPHHRVLARRARRTSCARSRRRTAPRSSSGTTPRVGRERRLRPERRARRLAAACRRRS